MYAGLFAALFVVLGSLSLDFGATAGTYALILKNLPSESWVHWGEIARLVISPAAPLPWAIWRAGGSAPWEFDALLAIPSAVAAAGGALLTLRMARGFARGGVELAAYASAGLLLGPGAVGAVALARARKLTADRAGLHGASIPGPFSGRRFLGVRAALLGCAVAAVPLFAILFARSPLSGRAFEDLEHTKSRRTSLIRQGAGVLSDAAGTLWRIDRRGWHAIPGLRINRRFSGYLRYRAAAGVRGTDWLFARDRDSGAETLLAVGGEQVRSFRDPFYAGRTGPLWARMESGRLVAFPGGWEAPRDRLFILDPETGRWTARRLPITRRFGANFVPFPKLSAAPAVWAVTGHGDVLHSTGNGARIGRLPGYSQAAPSHNVQTTSLSDGRGVALLRLNRDSDLHVYEARGASIRRAALPKDPSSAVALEKGCRVVALRGDVLWLQRVRGGAPTENLVSVDLRSGRARAFRFRMGGTPEPLFWDIELSTERLAILHRGELPTDRAMSLCVFRRDREPEIRRFERIVECARPADGSAWIFVIEGGKRATYRYAAGVLERVSGGTPFWRDGDAP